jgi:putative peptidoglycan lipid II flippase
MKFNQIFKSSFYLALFTLLSRISGFFRDIIFAKYLGTGMLSDAFFAAFKLPNTFRRIFAEGALSSAFVPIFAKEIKKNKKEALQFAGSIFISLSAVLLIITFFAIVKMPHIVGFINPGFKGTTLYIAINLSNVTFIFLFFISLTALLGSILNSINKFSYFAITPIIFNFIIIITGMFYSKYFQEYNVAKFFSYAVVFSGVIQFLFISIICFKYKVFPLIKNAAFDKKTLKMLQNFLPAILSGGVMQINIFVDSIFASFFPSAISYLYYTDRIVNLPLSLIGYSISTVILPEFSKLKALKALHNLQQLANGSIVFALFLSLPITLGVVVVARDVVSVLYYGNQFNITDLDSVTTMLQIYIVAMPFNVLYKIFISIFFANDMAKVTTKLSIFSLLLNILLNILFFNYFKIFSVAISTTLSSFAVCLLATLILVKRNILIINNKLIKNITTIALTSLIMFGLSNLLLSLYQNISNVSRLIYISAISATFYFIINFKLLKPNISSYKQYK